MDKKIKKILENHVFNVHRLEDSKKRNMINEIKSTSMTANNRTSFHWLKPALSVVTFITLILVAGAIIFDINFENLTQGINPDKDIANEKSYQSCCLLRLVCVPNEVY